MNNRKSNIKKNLLFSIVLLWVTTICYSQSTENTYSILNNQTMNENEILAFTETSEKEFLIDYGTSDLITATLAIETETELEVEDWMLEPFKSTNSKIQLKKLIAEDKESELQLEEWMVNMNKW